MTHWAQKNFLLNVKQKHPNYFKNTRVLEVGSYYVNGTMREYFENCDYVGIDVVAGRCVDVVCSGHEFKSEKRFDLVASCECFEHNVYWKETFENMINLTAPGGMVLFTCATIGRKEHGTTKSIPKDSPSCEIYGDYYRNLEESDFGFIDFKNIFSLYEMSSNHESKDLYFYGIKLTNATS